MKDSSPGKAETFSELAKQLADKEAEKVERLDKAIDKVSESHKVTRALKVLIDGLKGLTE